MSRRVDPIKAAIAAVAIQPFADGKPIIGVEAYDLHGLTETEFDIKVPTPHGPRYFTVKITEHY